MCIFDFLDILFGKDAKRSAESSNLTQEVVRKRTNKTQFLSPTARKSATIAATISKIASAIATTRNATDNSECCALLQKKAWQRVILAVFKLKRNCDYFAF